MYRYIPLDWHFHLLYHSFVRKEKKLSCHIVFQVLNVKIVIKNQLNKKLYENHHFYIKSVK